MAKYRVLVSRTRVIREIAVVHVYASDEFWATRTAECDARKGVDWTQDCAAVDTYDIEHVKEIAR